MQSSPYAGTALLQGQQQTPGTTVACNALLATAGWAEVALDCSMPPPSGAAFCGAPQSSDGLPQLSDDAVRAALEGALSVFSLRTDDRQRQAWAEDGVAGSRGSHGRRGPTALHAVPTLSEGA